MQSDDDGNQDVAKDARYCQLQNSADLQKLNQYTRKNFGEYVQDQK